jgi:hypothetical protein
MDDGRWDGTRHEATPHRRRGGRLLFLLVPAPSGERLVCRGSDAAVARWRVEATGCIAEVRSVRATVFAAAAAEDCL